MRIRFNNSGCQEILSIDAVIGHNEDNWEVFILYTDAWYVAEKAAGNEPDTQMIGLMSHDRYSTEEEAYEAAIKMIDHVFITGNLDLRYALEDYGLELI